MTKTDYTELDAAILAEIGRASPVLFTPLYAAKNVREAAERLIHTERQGQAWRVVDSRLQALRKAGKLKYQRKPEGWVLL